MNRQRQKSQDQVEIKSRKGVWRRFVRIFPKCRLPWVWLVLYVVLSCGLVEMGVSETEYTASLFAGDTSQKLLVTLVLVIIINILGSSAEVLVRMITSARINRNMRKVLYKKVMKLPMSFFSEDNPREAVYRVTNNAIVMDSVLILVALPLFKALYTMFAVLRRIFTYDWRLTLVMLAFLPIQILLAFLFGRINFSLNRLSSLLGAEFTEKLAELVTNIPLTKAFAKEKKEAKKGEELADRVYHLGVKTSWLSQFQDMSEAVVNFAQAGVISLTGMMLMNDGSINKRAWIAFFMFSTTFSGAVTELIMYWNNLKTIQGGADRLTEIMNAPEEEEADLHKNKKNRHAEKKTGIQEELCGDLIVQNVRFGYHENEPVLDGVDCVFRDNAVTALLGVSGSGKTTLVNLLLRLYRPQEGDILVDLKTPSGKRSSIYNLDLSSYRGSFAMVPQESMMFSGTIRENVCYGNENVCEEALIQALKDAGAYDFVMALPGGVDYGLEEYGNNISGGQRQRLAIARALLSDAHYIIFDEPTASMDAIGTAELVEVLKHISTGKCMIVIAHTAAILPLADRIVVLDHGKADAEGTSDEVIRSSEFVRDLIARQSQGAASESTGDASDDNSDDNVSDGSCHVIERGCTD